MPIRFKGLSLTSVVCAVKLKENIFSDAMPSINAKGGEMSDRSIHQLQTTFNFDHYFFTDASEGSNRNLST